MKELVKSIPILGDLAQRLYWGFLTKKRKIRPFPGSASYWEERYSAGGNSGVGSYGVFADFKADVLNEFVVTHNVQSVIEFGCGDGNQLRLANYPMYLGIDVSAAAVLQCQKLFKEDSRKSFRLLSEYYGEVAELALSLDVIYHLVEDNIFHAYMRALFDASNHYVIIYASESDDNRGYEGTHVKHRKFTQWIQVNTTEWTLVKRIPNRYPYRGDYREGSFADFFFYSKV